MAYEVVGACCAKNVKVLQGARNQESHALWNLSNALLNLTMSLEDDLRSIRQEVQALRQEVHRLTVER